MTSSDLVDSTAEVSQQCESQCKIAFRFNVNEFRDCLGLCRLLAEITFETGLFSEDPESNLFWKLGGLFHWMWATRRLGGTRGSFWFTSLRDPDDGPVLWRRYLHLLCAAWVTAWASSGQPVHPTKEKDGKSFSTERNAANMKIINPSSVALFQISFRPDYGDTHTRNHIHSSDAGTEPSRCRYRHCCNPSGVPADAIHSAAAEWKGVAQLIREVSTGRDRDTVERAGRPVEGDYDHGHGSGPGSADPAAMEGAAQDLPLEALFCFRFKKAMEETTRQWLSINSRPHNSTNEIHQSSSSSSSPSSPSSPSPPRRRTIKSVEDQSSLPSPSPSSPEDKLAHFVVLSITTALAKWTCLGGPMTANDGTPLTTNDDTHNSNWCWPITGSQHRYCFSELPTSILPTFWDRE